MARISHLKPMQAYDHIADLLKDAAGADGIVSKKDAKKLVNDLKAEGRGTEAVAAENLFKMMDAFNDQPGQRVTGYDMKLTRSFVQKKMLENRDINHNGYSRAEIDKMSPTGKALVELGQYLAIEAKPGRTAHSVPQKGMEHVANLISSAKGNDPFISRDDVKKLVSDLYKQGRGTEAVAVGTFYSFMDHRDYKKGARVTLKDVAKAVEYSGTKLLTGKDINRNGYSAAEVKNFSKSAKAFLMIGKMINAGIIKPAQ